MKAKVSLGLALVCALALVWGLVGMVSAEQPGEPQPGTVHGVRGPDTFWNGTAIAGTTVTYTAVPKTVYGTDVSIVWLYHSMDVFVTVDVAPSKAITVTPQFSSDASNWVDATYTYVADTLASTTSVITSTGRTTATTTTSMSSAVTETPYRVILSTDTSDYLRVPLAGKYVRFKIEHSGTVTPTIKVLLRND